MAPCDLQGLLAPVDAKTFLRTCWGKNFQHVRGGQGKFADLLPWPVLNDILQQHRLDSPRLRLTREGKPVPATNYASFPANRKRPGQTIPRLKAADLMRELREGATLVLDAVDELHPPVTDIAEALEREFRVRIQVNGYAGWRTSHGFDLHWDDHDVFVLQIAGRKDWKIYGLSAERPETPIWEGRVEDGDLLYIPRGWWHVATPLDEPTLHLTVGVSNPTGADLLSWLVEKLRANECVSRDLPQFSSADEQKEYLDQIQKLVARSWSSDLLDQYFGDLDTKAQPRPRFSLPWTASPDVLPPDAVSFTLRWNGARRMNFEGKDGEVHFVAQGKRWRFAAAARPMLERLTAGSACSLSDLSGLSDAETARAFVAELVVNGLVAVVDA